MVRARRAAGVERNGSRTADFLMFRCRDRYVGTGPVPEGWREWSDEQLATLCEKLGRKWEPPEAATLIPANARTLATAEQAVAEPRRTSIRAKLTRVARIHVLARHVRFGLSAGRRRICRR